jgi:hypothetical protein
MNLQQKILQRYRQIYPKDSLKEISNRTGIQQTRVFRLLQGKAMKVKELEVFEEIINEKIAEKQNFSRLSSIVEEASCILTNEEISKVSSYISRKVLVRKYSRLYVSSNYESAHIA